MKVLYPSVHSPAMNDLLPIFKDKNIDVYFPTLESNVFDANVPLEQYKNMGLNNVLQDNEEIMQSIYDGFFDYVVIMTHLQYLTLVDLNKQLNKKLKYIYFQSGGLGWIYSSKHYNIDNFFSPSQKSIELMNCSNYFHAKKLFPFQEVSEHEQIRNGFYSYINYYENFPNSYNKFLKINSLLNDYDFKVINFGMNHEKPNVVNDLEYMVKAKATLHLKDFGGVCNAVIRSLACGTPVIMDNSTYDNGFYHDIKGISLINDIKDIINELIKLNCDEEYLRQSIANVKQYRNQFEYDTEYGDNFMKFLERC